MRTSFWTRLHLPTDSASLALFRLCFGLAMAWQSIKFWRLGWIDRDYIEPDLHFTYFGFGWVHPWPDNGMYFHFALMTVAAVFVAIGFWYRTSAIALFLTTTYWFLLDTTEYNNHYYLECLLAFVFMLIPAQRGFSVDAWRKPQRYGTTVPRGAIWLLRFQVGVVYFYGGIAKFDPDWLTGVPLRAFLGASKNTAYFLAYGGLALDLLIVPLLLSRRTRLIAYLVALAFHLTNATLFSIGVFPWFMIAATLIFFDADAPRQWLRWRTRRQPVPEEQPANQVTATGPFFPVTARIRGHSALWAAYVAIQLLVPLRHHLYPGRVTWSEEGLRFAWHMMLRHKVAKTEFAVFSQDGEPLEIEADMPLNPRQWQFMQYDPASILQFAHYLAGQARQQGFPKPQVKALVYCSLNGRDPQLLVDQRVDLAQEYESLRPFSWVIPLQRRKPPPSPFGGRLDAEPPRSD